MKKNIDGWKNPASSYTVQPDRKIRGKYYIGNAEFTFSASPAPPGAKYKLQGSISLHSADGSVMKVGGKEVRKVLYLKRSDADYIKKYIAEKAQSIFSEHAKHILLPGIGFVDKKTMPFAIAAEHFAQVFAREKYPKASERENKERIKTLKTMCSLFPPTPICELSKNQVYDTIDKYGLSANDVSLLNAFWNYLLNKHAIACANPIDDHVKKKPSTKSLAASAKSSGVLSIEQQDELFAALIASPSGLACGAMLELSGLSASEACAAKWKQIVFDNSRNDFAQLKIRRDDLAGATHDYIRPLLPTTALILRKRYTELLKDNRASTLAGYPVVSSSFDKQVAPDALREYVVDILRGFKLSAFSRGSKEATNQILQRTYAYDLAVVCGLDQDLGSSEFLQGRKLSTVTDDHYASYSSPEAQERLYATLHVLAPEQPIDTPPDTKTPAGQTVHVFAPKTTREIAGAVIEIDLAPGEEIRFDCPHGVQANFRVDPLPEDDE